MSKPKLTPWFPASVKPVHEGVYQTYDPTQRRHYYNRFDGINWHYGWDFIGDGDHEQYDPMANHLESIQHWRGLASNPEKTE